MLMKLPLLSSNPAEVITENSPQARAKNNDSSISCSFHNTASLGGSFDLAEQSRRRHNRRSSQARRHCSPLVRDTTGIKSPPLSVSGGGCSSRKLFNTALPSTVSWSISTLAKRSRAA